jgi:hypothetical protein
MIHLKHNHRPLFAEARLSYKVLGGPTGPSSAPGTPPDKSTYEYLTTEAQELIAWMGKGVGVVAEWSTETAADFTAWAAEVVVSVPVGVLKGLKNSWEKHLPERMEVMRVLTQVGDFFRDSAVMKSLFGEYVTESEFNNEELLQLTDQVQWVTLFRNHEGVLFKKEIPEDVAAAHPALAKFLSRISVQDRQRIYMEYMDRFVPQEQQNYMDISSVGGKSPEERFMKLIEINKTTGKTNLPVTNGILGAVLGMEDWDAKLVNKGGPKDPIAETRRNEALTIARDSLKTFYKNDRLGFPDVQSRGLQNDFKAALQYEKLAGFPPAATNAGLLKKNLPTSRFRGALNLGVVTDEDLRGLETDVRGKDHERNLTLGQNIIKLETLTKATELKNRMESKTMVDMWNGLGGIQKLLLVGAAGYAVYNSKFMRRAALGLVGAYFVQKMVLKNDDPLKTWSGWLNKGVNKVKNANAKMFGISATPASVDDIAYRATMMSNYLDDFDRSNLETQVTGFSLIGDVPLSALAKNFNMDKTGWTFNAKDPTLRKIFTKGLKERGWSASSADKFFQDPNNEGQVGEALGFVFYDIARKNPVFADDARLVDETQKKLPDNASLSRIGELSRYNYETKDPVFHKQIVAANEAYMRLVAAGRTESLGKGMLLKDYIGLNSGLKPAAVAVAPAAPAAAPSATTVASAASVKPKKLAKGSDDSAKGTAGDGARTETTDGEAEAGEAASETETRTSGEATESKTAPGETGGTEPGSETDTDIASGGAESGATSDEAVNNGAADGAAAETAADETAARNASEAALGENASEAAISNEPGNSSDRTAEGDASRTDTGSSEGKTAEAGTKNKNAVNDASVIEAESATQNDAAGSESANENPSGDSTKTDTETPRTQGADGNTAEKKTGGDAK